MIKLLFLIATSFLITESPFQEYRFSFKAYIKDSLSLGDTLSFAAEFIECGEFGGNKEFVKIYKRNDQAIFTVSKYKADCKRISPQGIPYKKVYSVTRKLDTGSIEAIENYSRTLQLYKPNSDNMVHFGNIFKVYTFRNSNHIYHYTLNDTLTIAHKRMLKTLLQ